MAVVEGVGDEVTLLLGLLLLLLVLLLAWASTRTQDPAPESQRAPERPQGDTPTSSASLPSGSTPSEQLPQAAVGGDKPGEGLRSRGRDERNSLVLRLKFLNDTERTATVQPQDTVGHIKRTFFSGQEAQVRLIFQGQLLQDDDATVSDLNLSHMCVLHCHISQQPAPGQTGQPGRGPGRGPGPEQVNVGGLMVPLLVLMLLVLWYCQVQYRQFFTAPATATLAGLTVLLSLVAFGVYRR
ncbi:transmembrane and ubiquitin-like domain-containing protein 1 [Eucyclogobius newberryi]|uniref:transmembrane and ubiquitin-like domain-containing protein 1 n=1 Tax=Eucyclogobius newberryi TaxID=166745 RepID=UPI003B5AEE25